MSRGVIYCMTTIVPGLIKIGRTGSENYENRMYHLEHNGYCNVVGLKREFAIEVNDYEEKEELLHDIFSKSRVADTELFSVDIDLVIQLLSSLEGKQIYPINISKKAVFEKATLSRDIECIPDGDYYFKVKPNDSKRTYKATMKVEGTKLTLLKGSEIVNRCNLTVTGWIEAKKNAKIENEVLLEDVECDSPSMACAIVSGTHLDGWESWKTVDGKAIDIFRKKEVED